MDIIDKFKGSLIGLACGDYLGMPVEFSRGREDVADFFDGEKLKPVDFTDSHSIRRKAGYYTDDTCMAMCLAESLNEKGFDVKDQFRRYQKWLYEGYNTPFGDKSFGVGDNTFRALSSQNKDNLPASLENNPSQGGNGALMRCAPIGLFYYNNLEALKAKSIESAIITHNNIDAAWSCVVLNSFIAYSILGHKKEDFIKLFLAQEPECPGAIKELLEIDYLALPDKMDLPNTGFTLHTLQIALYSFFRSNNFESAVTTSVFMGGDTDTQGAVTGALAGAYYSFEDIPSIWVKTLINREYIEKQAVNLYDKIASNL